MVGSWLVMIRHLMLSGDGELNSATGCPSIATMRSPGRNPAAQAGPVGSAQPIVVLLSSSFTGRPTPQTNTAKPSASKKLNKGPAKATMILSKAEIGGNALPELSPFPSIASIEAIWGSAT